jgi:predicted nuclease with TOPRIM domain
VATASKKYAPQSYSEKIYYAITMGGQTKTVDGRVPTIRRPGVSQGYVPPSVTQATGVKPEDVTRTTQQIQTRAPTATTKTVTTAVQNTVERNLATQNLALKRVEAQLTSRVGSTGKVTQTVQESASKTLVTATSTSTSTQTKVQTALGEPSILRITSRTVTVGAGAPGAWRSGEYVRFSADISPKEVTVVVERQASPPYYHVIGKKYELTVSYSYEFNPAARLESDVVVRVEGGEEKNHGRSSKGSGTLRYYYVANDAWLSANNWSEDRIRKEYEGEKTTGVSVGADIITEYGSRIRGSSYIRLTYRVKVSFTGPALAPPSQDKVGPSGETKEGESTKPKDIPVTDVDVNELKRRKDSVMKELEQARTNRIIRSKRLEDLRSRISSLEAMIPSLQQMRDRLTAELNDLLSRAQTAVSETADSIMAKISAVEQEIAGLRTQRSQLQSQIQQLESIVSDLRGRLSQAGVSMQLRYRYAISIRQPGVTQGGYIARTTGVAIPETVPSAADLSKLKEQLRADVSREESELSGIRSELESLAGQIAPLESRLTDLSSARAALEDEIKSLQQRVEELRGRVVDSTPGDLKSLQSRLQSLLSERDSLLSEVNNLIARVQSLLSEKSSLESMLSGLGLPKPPTIEIPPITPPITPEVPTVPPLTIPQIPTLPPTIPQTPSADIQMLLQQFQNMQQQMMNQLATMMQLQQRAPYDPSAQAMLQQLQAERAMLMQQIQSLQQQLLMASQQRPQDVSLPVLMMLVSQMQNQSRGIEQYLPVIFQMMMESRSSTERDALRDYVDQLNRERTMLQAQIAMLQQQIESLKAAPPAPPAPPKPAWYPGMIITSILGAIFGRAG